MYRNGNIDQALFAIGIACPSRYSDSHSIRPAQYAEFTVYFYAIEVILAGKTAEYAATINV
jgi:hypothetical protein